MKNDPVDDILEQWSEERPELETASLGVVVRILSLYKRLSREANQALRPLDLELFEYDVLSALRRQGAPFALHATELARQTGLSGGAMTNRVDKLAERKLVRRAADSGDRRAVIVSLTTRGCRVIDEAIQLRLGSAERSLAALSARERRQLADLLRKVWLAGADA